MPWEVQIMPELLCGGIPDGIFRNLAYSGVRNRY